MSNIFILLMLGVLWIDKEKSIQDNCVVAFSRVRVYALGGL
jgi:hypothetical protein